MNAKKCKELRHATQYRNQTATPGIMDFPGVARGVKVPIFVKGVQQLDSEGQPAYEMQFNSKPGKLRANEPKGVYRAIKKFVRQFGYGALTFTARQDFIQGKPV